MAALGTVIITLTLILYAAYTKTDFTVYGGILSIGLCCLFFVSLINVFFFRISFLNTAICGFGLFIYGCYLVYDT